MSITKYFIPLTTRESAKAETLEAGKAAAEAVITAGKDEIAGRKWEKSFSTQVQQRYKNKNNKTRTDIRQQECNGEVLQGTWTLRA